jgi:hypothetical protein
VAQKSDNGLGHYSPAASAAAKSRNTAGLVATASTAAAISLAGSEFFQEIQDAFSQAGDENSVFPIRHSYQR